MFNSAEGFPFKEQLGAGAKENRVLSMKVMLQDGSLKYIPLYSIFDSTIVKGPVLFEKKGMFSKSWKKA